MIPVFYRREQSCDAAVGYSPSAGKPALVMQDWANNFLGDFQVETFNPATREMLYTAHDPAYVDAVLDGERNNGFGNRDPKVAQSLLYTVGSMVAAAKHVLAQWAPERMVAVSPTSGFHHAGFASGGGFCTLNGLMVTAMWLKHLGLVDKVLILDFDQHYGNGTQDIIDHFDLDWVTHITAGRSYNTADEALGQIRMLKRYADKVDLVLYQAGADIHVDDPLGGIMTTEQMYKRDRYVLRTCCQYGMPLVWNLAGGYQRDKTGGIEPVLALHRQTMDVCLQQYR